MNAKVIDSHCHLTDSRLLGQIDGVIDRARSAGIAAMVTVGCGPEDSARAAELAGRFDDVWFAAAIHPHDAKRYSPESADSIARLLDHPRAVALGEIGLDYHYDFSPRDAQRAAFAAQLRAAGQRDLPVIVHSREAVADALAIVAEAGMPVRGVFHSFTGSVSEARAILDAGFCLSLSGVVTFGKAGELREVARLVPGDRLLLETDAPYLSPEPMRKVKVNEPALLVHTLACVAGLRGQSPDELAECVSRNARELFGL